MDHKEILSKLKECDFIIALVTFKTKDFACGEYEILSRGALSMIDYWGQVEKDLIEIENLFSFKGWCDVFFREKMEGELTLYKNGNTYGLQSWEEGRADKRISFEDIASKSFKI
jgi:hypothetical protein